MILIDTSIWIEYLRGRNETVQNLLDAEQVLVHPFVIGEIACGNLANREEVFSMLLGSLPVLPTASDLEVLYFIESNGLMGRGIGYIDFHLLTATALAIQPTHLWTWDKRLNEAAQAMELAYRPGE